MWASIQAHFHRHRSFCKAVSAASAVSHDDASPDHGAAVDDVRVSADDATAATDGRRIRHRRLVERRRRLCDATSAALQRPLAACERDAIVFARACWGCWSSPTGSSSSSSGGALKACDHCGHGFHCADSPSCAAAFASCHGRQSGVCVELAVALAVQQVTNAAAAAGRDVPLVFVPPVADTVYLPLLRPDPVHSATATDGDGATALSGWDAGVDTEAGVWCARCVRRALCCLLSRGYLSRRV